MSIEERMQLEKKAREAEYQARPRDDTGKFIRPPTAPQEGVDEIAQKIADKAVSYVTDSCFLMGRLHKKYGEEQQHRTHNAREGDSRLKWFAFICTSRG